MRRPRENNQHRDPEKTGEKLAFWLACSSHSTHIFLFVHMRRLPTARQPQETNHSDKRLLVSTQIIVDPMRVPVRRAPTFL